MSPVLDWKTLFLRPALHFNKSTTTKKTTEHTWSNNEYNFKWILRFTSSSAWPSSFFSSSTLSRSFLTSVSCCSTRRLACASSAIFSWYCFLTLEWTCRKSASSCKRADLLTPSSRIKSSLPFFCTVWQRINIKSVFVCALEGYHIPYWPNSWILIRALAILG